MANERKLNPERSYVRGILPWAVGGVALLIYLLTLNHWVSFGNVEQVANTAGWNWYPQLFAPANYLLTLPIRWLPVRYIPIALNLLAAFCGAASLALLARSVTLLPHDRTQEQRDKERSALALLSIRTAWIPPIIAIISCGLGLTFWEYATSFNAVETPWGGGSEMLNLLFFAYTVRCILEFRFDQKESWLIKAALVYGVSVANNWVMIGFFPVLLTSLIWSRGLAFFDGRFLIRLFLAGFAGLSLYLLLPIVQSSSDFANVDFWPALKINLGGQLYVLKSLCSKWNLFHAEKPLWVLSLYSLLPLLALSIKWPSYFGDTSKLGIAVATFTSHLLHAFGLVLCAWVALDPPVSPRFHAPWLPFMKFPFLMVYYMAAIGLGYLVGYFLLLFSSPQTPAQQRRTHPVMRYIEFSVTGLIYVICLFLPAALIFKNLPQIRAANGPAYSQFASLMNESLPAKDTVVLSDDRRRLMLLQSYAARSHASRHLMFLDSSLLKVADYHRFLKKRYGDRWPVTAPKGTQDSLTPVGIASLLFGLQSTNDLYYLHPSFGYYFEAFDLEPHGLIYKMTVARTNDLRSPLASPELKQENDAFWSRVSTDVAKPLTNAIAASQPMQNPDLPNQILKSLHIVREPNRALTLLAQFYSRSLDYWGVELQRLGDLTGAGKTFEEALRLNPGNLVASANLHANKTLRSGGKLAVGDPQNIRDEFGEFRSWDDVMTENGPFDEPSFNYAQGCQLTTAGLYRQAAQQLDRVRALAPWHLQARLLLAVLYVRKEIPDEAIKIVNNIRSRPDLYPINRGNVEEIMYAETSAKLANHDDAAAQATVSKTLHDFPDDQQLMLAAVHIYMNYARFTNAIPLIEQLLQSDPTNSDLVLTYGVANLQAERYDTAIPLFTQVINAETNPASDLHYMGVLNRAIAYLKSGKLKESRQDYELIQKQNPTEPRIYYGLGDIAYQERDTNAALRNYYLYLTNSPANPDEINKVNTRLKELRPGYP